MNRVLRPPHQFRSASEGLSAPLRLVARASPRGSKRPLRWAEKGGALHLTYRGDDAGHDHPASLQLIMLDGALTIDRSPRTASFSRIQYDVGSEFHSYCRKGLPGRTGFRLLMRFGTGLVVFGSSEPRPTFGCSCFLDHMWFNNRNLDESFLGKMRLWQGMNSVGDSTRKSSISAATGFHFHPVPTGMTK